MSVTITIKALDQFSQTFSKVKKELSALNAMSDKSMKNTIAQISLLNKKIEELGKKRVQAFQSAGSGVGFLSDMNQFLGAAEQFENKFASLQGVLQGFTEDEIQGVKNGLIEMSKTIPLTLGELTAFAEIAAKASIPKEQLLPFTENMAKASVGELALQTSTLTSKIILLQNAFDRLSISMSPVLGTYGDLIDKTTELIDKITKFVNNNKNLSSTLFILVGAGNLVFTALSTLGAALLTARTGVLGLIRAGTLLKAALVESTIIMKLKSAAMYMLSIASRVAQFAVGSLRGALISSGIGAIVVGIGMAAYLLIQHWDSVKQMLEPIINKITGFFKAIWDTVSSIFGPGGSLSDVSWLDIVLAPLKLYGEYCEWLFGIVEKILNIDFSKIKDSVMGFFGGDIKNLFTGLFQPKDIPKPKDGMLNVNIGFANPPKGTELRVTKEGNHVALGSVIAP